MTFTYVYMIVRMIDQSMDTGWAGEWLYPVLRMRAGPMPGPVYRTPLILSTISIQRGPRPQTPPQKEGGTKLVSCPASASCTRRGAGARETSMHEWRGTIVKY